jgi:cobyrinic acid a,c-diamide synthase
MSRAVPRICMAGTGSGVGKTSLTVGIVAALRRRGLRVQTFKVGPDFLDPTHLALASGRPCYNLDGWMTNQAYVRQLFARTTQDADLAIIEGVMGLFDGASPSSLAGSTAEVARWLEAPVVLLVNAHGVGRSVAAMVKGFTDFDPALRLAGVIANQAGGERHAGWLAESLQAAGLAPLLGAVPRGALPTLPSRHLGLVAADSGAAAGEINDKLADACARLLDLDLLLRLAADAPAVTAVESLPTPPVAPRTYARPVRIGIARDAAFSFYYPDNLEWLAQSGATLVEFSPLHDGQLPADLAGIYLGGGYPELHAAALAQNHAMLAAIRAFVAAGGAVYAECGGLMYLAQGVTDLAGVRFPLAGVLPIETAMLKSRKALGYVEATPTAATLWTCAADAGALRLRGHEFHYSTITQDDSAAAGWQPAYAISRRRSGAVEAEGFCKGAVLASYVHLHFASAPAAQLFNLAGGSR